MRLRRPASNPHPRPRTRSKINHVKPTYIPQRLFNRASPGVRLHPGARDLDAWCDWMERIRALDRLVLADVELRQARPATDAEWAAFLEREFPRVGGGS